MAELAPASNSGTVLLGRRAWVMAAAFWVGLLSVGVVGVSWYLRNEERALQASVQLRGRTTVDALNQTLLRTIEAIEGIHALLQARHELLTRGSERGAEAIGDYLVDLVAKESFGILQVATTDAAGIVNFSTVPQWRPLDLRDREHIRVHFDRPPALFVSTPLIGRVSGRWSVQITYPLLNTSDGFDGVAVVSLDPILLSNRMAEVAIGEGAIAALLRLPDGALLARSRDAERQLERAPLPSHKAVMGARDAPQGSIRTMSLVDGREVIMSFRQVRDGAMVMAFAEDWEIASEPLMVLRRWAWWSFTLVMLLTLLGMLASLRAAGLRAARQLLARAEAERAATASAWARLEQLLEAAPVAIYAGRGREWPEPAFETDFTSPNLPRVTGWGADVFADPEQARARMDASSWEARQAFHRITLDDGRAVLEYRWRWPDGSWRWLREEARRVGEAGPGVFEVVGYLLDVTEQRQAEAWAAASARLNMLGELAANMAHELNQPLAVISLAAENASVSLEQDGPAGIPEALETLELVSLQATRCKAVVQHLRLFSSPDQRQALGVVKLETVIQGTMLLVRGALRDAGITLHNQLPAELPPIRANAVGAEQVFVNLFLNARDALVSLPPGTPRAIWVSAAVEDGRLRVSFADSGGGIPPDLLGRVFEPFFTTKTSDKGTGLGLAICQAAMRGFGGEISVQNGPLGAEFTLDFPLAEAGGERAPAPHAALGAA